MRKIEKEIVGKKKDFISKCTRSDGIRFMNKISCKNILEHAQKKLTLV